MHYMQGDGVNPEELYCLFPENTWVTAPLTAWAHEKNKHTVKKPKERLPRGPGGVPKNI